MVLTTRSIRFNVKVAVSNSLVKLINKNSHRFDIHVYNYDRKGYASNVVLHFNSETHSISDVVARAINLFSRC